MFINTHKKKKKLSLPEATHVEIDGNAVFVWGFFLHPRHARRQNNENMTIIVWSRNLTSIVIFGKK